MTTRDVVTLNETTPQLEVPQVGDTYNMPRSVSVTGDFTVTGTVDGRDIAADGALLDTAVQPADLTGYLAATDIDTLAELNAIVTDATLIDTGDSRLSDARTPTAHNQAWSTITATPTTMAGYGISDTKTNYNTALSDGSFMFVGDAPTSHTHTESEITDLGTYVVLGGALGTPTSGTLTNCTGTASGLTAGNVTTNANLTGHITSTGNAAILGSFTLAQLNTAVSDATLVEFERRDIAFSDESTDLTTGTKATFHMPNYATTLLEVSVGMTTAPAGSTAVFDLNEAGTSVLSTKISVDAGERTSETAATPPVISDSALAANALMTVDVDQVGSGTAGTGGKLYLKYKKA